MPEQPELGHPLHDLERELLALVRIRPPPGATTSSANSRTAAPEAPLLLRQVEVHRRSA